MRMLGTQNYKAITNRHIEDKTKKAHQSSECTIRKMTDAEREKYCGEDNQKPVGKKPKMYEFKKRG